MTAMMNLWFAEHKYFDQQTDYSRATVHHGITGLIPLIK
jgi:hypothetical protein